MSISREKWGVLLVWLVSCRGTFFVERRFDNAILSFGLFVGLCVLVKVLGKDEEKEYAWEKKRALSHGDIARSEKGTGKDETYACSHHSSSWIRLEFCAKFQDGSGDVTGEIAWIFPVSLVTSERY